MEHSVCFIGHRKINDTPQLRKRLRQVLSQLIESGTAIAYQYAVKSKKTIINCFFKENI